MDPELDSAQNPRPAAPAVSPEPASAGEPADTGEAHHIQESHLDLIADKLLAGELATESPDKGLKAQSKTYKHPMAIDLLLAIGLLFAMAGLTVSFVKTYITHSAKTSILQGNYKAAIGILHGSPIPEFFGGAGTDNSEDLLNQALYLDAMEKLDNNRDDQTALQELSKVSASQGSFYYDLAQDQFRKLKKQEHNADTESVNTEPGKTEPGKSEPGKIEPGKTEPPKTEPATTEPTKTEPIPSEELKQGSTTGDKAKENATAPAPLPAEAK